ncbi:MAG: hypothetical protein N4A36_00320 [Candidatus Gracilibacteria bacterium]|nr:hypothetical protein [Candidatus Gracilibacteria bacterium]
MHLPIAEIKENVVVLKNGGIRAIFQTSSVNFNLKSEEEQNSIIYAFQGFLNTLEYPIQILIRSKKLNVDSYMDNLQEVYNKQENPLLKKQTFEYMEYIKKLVEYADIMEKNFYVVVPYDPIRAKNPNMWSQFIENIRPTDSLEAIRQRHREFASLKKGLDARCSSVQSGLEGCNLRAERLITKQLTELFFEIYNPTLSRNQKLRSANGTGDLNLLQN